MEDSSTKKGWRAALTGNVLMLGLVSFFTDASSEMIYPLMPVFIAGLAATPGGAAVALGLMEGIAESTASLLKLVAGHWSDKAGRRKPLTLLGYGVSPLPTRSRNRSGTTCHAAPASVDYGVGEPGGAGDGVQLSPGYGSCGRGGGRGDVGAASVGVPGLCPVAWRP